MAKKKKYTYTYHKYLKDVFATFPSVKLYDIVEDSKTKQNKLVFIKELLFGDFMRVIDKDGGYDMQTIEDGKNAGTYVKVHCRNADGYIKIEEMQDERPLEVNFIDVGQGDGCHIVTPDDEHFLIDAGQSDNMFRFLRWRFNLTKSSTPPPPFSVVISHPDADHYYGFKYIFDTPKEYAQQFSFTKVYHNGLMEAKTIATGKDNKATTADKLRSLGTLLELTGHQYSKYITDLCDTNEDYKARAASVDAGDYMDILAKADAEKESLRAGSVLYEKGKLKMEVLAPIPETIDGKDALPAFDNDKGRTKNGNSVVLLLTMGNMKILLGGDLNIPAEHYLLQRYSGGINVPSYMKSLTSGTAKKLKPETKAKYEAEVEKAVELAKNALQVDIAKSCHHGSADFSSEFLRALNPIATVISSGDEESFVHPRPDTIGTIGKHSRGERPLVFSTELARSGKEFLDVSKLKDEDVKKERVVTVYGMINVRTDGKNAIIAQKRESPASQSNWDIHKLIWNEEKGEFEYIMD